MPFTWYISSVIARGAGIKNTGYYNIEIGNEPMCSVQL